MTKATKAQRNVAAAVKHLVAEVRRDMKPIIAALDAEAPIPPGIKEAMIAQNVLRQCMAAVVEQCVPIDAQFCADLATRLAGYAITMAPPELDRALITLVRGALPEQVRVKRRQGAVIKVTWLVDGEKVMNTGEAK